MYDIDGRIADLREQLRTLERSREILQRLDQDSPREPRPPSITASAIRDFVWQQIIRPARARGTTKLSVRCGDVHRQMGLRDRLPSVVSALEARRFAAHYGLTLLSAEGPKAGSNRILTFEIPSVPAPDAQSEPDSTPVEEGCVPA